MFIKRIVYENGYTYYGENDFISEVDEKKILRFFI